MTQDLNSLACALYARTEALLKAHPDLAPWRPAIGFQPRLSDADLVTLALMQALTGHTSEARWLRYTRTYLSARFPYLPQQSGYNKRLRKATGLIRTLIRHLATDTSAWTDDTWVVDSTPIECARSRETVKRSDLAGWAAYGYCASHSRFFWGLRLHLVCTLSGLPVAFALTGAKAYERTTLVGMFENDPGLVAQRPGQTLIADKNYYGCDFERCLAQAGLSLLRPARKGGSSRARSGCFGRCGRSSSRSTRPSGASWTWSGTAGALRAG
ncbi:MULTISPECIES: IS982 family transposase [unclassified Nocardiopsis]|uniref:IS982 family transposase n=1 Tax=unclassified Nocardiopsis TaxID=2649073 RepID=UPI001F19215D|nr:MULTISPECIES: IS982 family transposase [unclassified Nocardiopsis]